MNNAYDEEMILANTSSISGGFKKKSKKNQIKSLFKISKKNKIKKGKSKKNRKVKK
jgi:hypothetical protein